MTPEEKKAKRVAYLAANREKIAAQNAAYYVGYRAANREKISARTAAYRAANRERLLAHRAAYRAANPESKCLEILRRQGIPNPPPELIAVHAAALQVKRIIKELSK